MSTKESPAQSRRWRICAEFAALYIGLEAIYVAIPDESLLHGLNWILVTPTASLLGHVHSADDIHVIGNRLISSRVDFSVVRGCDGSGFLFLLVAALLAFPSAWRLRLFSALLAAGLTYGLNLIRLLVLYEVQRSHPQWFIPVHVYWAPGVLLAAGTLFFLAWIQRVYAISFKS